MNFKAKIYLRLFNNESAAITGDRNIYETRKGQIISRKLTNVQFIKNILQCIASNGSPSLRKFMNQELNFLTFQLDLKK